MRERSLELLPLAAFSDQPSLKTLQPSIVASNLAEGCGFIAKIGKRLGFPIRTVCTAQLYFHLFYMKHSMVDFSHMDIALTSVLMASKAEETYKRIHQVIEAAMQVLSPELKSVEIRDEHRRRIIKYEFQLLCAINFQFCLVHPFTHIASICKTLGISKRIAFEAFDMIRRWYETPIMLFYHAEYLAVAALERKLKEIGEGMRYFERWKEHERFSNRILQELYTFLDRHIELVHQSGKKLEEKSNVKHEEVSKNRRDEYEQRNSREDRSTKHREYEIDKRESIEHSHRREDRRYHERQSRRSRSRSRESDRRRYHSSRWDDSKHESDKSRHYHSHEYSSRYKDGDTRRDTSRDRHGNQSYRGSSHRNRSPEDTYDDREDYYERQQKRKDLSKETRHSSERKT